MSDFDQMSTDTEINEPIKKSAFGNNLNISRPMLLSGLLGVTVLGIGAWYLLNQTPSDSTAVVDPTATTTPVTAPPAAAPTTPESPTSNPTTTTPSRTLEVQQIPLLATAPVTPPTGKPGKGTSVAVSAIVRPSAPRNVNPFAPLPTNIPTAPASSLPQIVPPPPSAPLPRVPSTNLPAIQPTNPGTSVIVRNSTPLPPIPGAFAPLKPVPTAVATSKPVVRAPSVSSTPIQPPRPSVVTRPLSTIATGALPIAPPILQNTTVARPKPVKPVQTNPPAPPIVPPATAANPPAPPAPQPTTLPPITSTPPTPPAVTPTPPPVVTPPSPATPEPASPPPPATANPTPPPAPTVNPPPTPPAVAPATPPIAVTPPASPPTTATTTATADLQALETYVQENSLLYQGFVAGTTTQGAFSSSKNAFFLIALGEKFPGSSIALKSADENQAVIQLGTQTLTLKKK